MARFTPIPGTYPIRPYGQPMTIPELALAWQSGRRVWTHDCNAQLRFAKVLSPPPRNTLHVEVLIDGEEGERLRSPEHIFATTTDYWFRLLSRRECEGLRVREALFFDHFQNMRFRKQLARWQIKTQDRYQRLRQAYGKREEKLLAHEVGYRLPVLGEPVRYHAFAPMGDRTQAETFYPATIVEMSCEHPMYGWTLRVTPPALFVLPGEPYITARILGSGDARLHTWSHYPDGEAPPPEPR